MINPQINEIIKNYEDIYKNTFSNFIKAREGKIKMIKIANYKML